MDERDDGGIGLEGDSQKVMARLIEDEMRESFIDYSMSVIVQRALPDVRDGLKPVHRRILYGMSGLGLTPGRAHKKSATVVGEVLGKYHPHGDAAVYDALVRMVQDFSLRYPLIDGQGNFGSIDGDSAAAYRYTEARLTPLAMELLEDIDKETVPFVPNFDGRIEEPTVLPAKLPNLLVNGSSGIAVGMATNIPPHNLCEVTEACIGLIEEPNMPQEELETLVLGPDFPTGGYICGQAGIRDAYRTGRGRLVTRARVETEEDDGGERIIVTQIPFMVNKSRLIEQIVQLVRDKKITDIRDLRDESDRDGMRIVIELRRDAISHIVLNRLYKHTQMQVTFGAIMLALVDGVPRVMSLRDMLLHFVEHRHDVVVRRTKYDLGRAREREHTLEGLKIAVDNIDDVIVLIRASPDAEVAGTQLRERFELTEHQAKAILDMRLARLTGLEITRLDEELAEVRDGIRELDDILGSRPRRMLIVSGELRELAEKYGDERKTEIAASVSDLDVEDLIAEEDMVLTVSRQGYVKRVPIDTYRAQKRGGRGMQGMGTRDEDWVEHLFVASTHDYLMVFTRSGRCYWIKVWEIPEARRAARGRPIVNLLSIEPGEEIAAFVPVREFRDDSYLLFCTLKGVVKKTPLSAYSNVRSVGLNAINVRDSDELIDVQITDGGDEVVLATQDGLAIRFREANVRPMGRATEGVRGIRLAGDDVVVGMVVVHRDSTLLVVTEHGMGKRSHVKGYRLQQRGGKGVLNLRVTKKTGRVVSINAVDEHEQLMVITRNGVVNRQPVAEIRVIGRATQGVRLVNLDDGDTVMDVARVVVEDNGNMLERVGPSPATGGGASTEPLADDNGSR